MTDPADLLTPPGSGVSFGTMPGALTAEEAAMAHAVRERRAEVGSLAEEIRQALPTPGEAATGVATSAAGSMIAAAAIPLPFKLAVVGAGLLFVGWRWMRRKKA